MSLFDVAKEEIGAGQQSRVIATAWGSEKELVAFIADGNKPSEKDGIGSRTFQRIFDWLETEHPDAERSFYEENKAYATEFVDGDDADTHADCDFAFVCPRCRSHNPLEGDPDGFRDRPFACVDCRWVSCLLGDAIGDFIDGTDTDTETHR